MITIYKSVGGKPKEVKEPTKGCWIHVETPTDDDLKALQDMIEVPDEAISFLKDIDEQPKTERYKQFLFILFRIPHKKKKGESVEYSTTPLGILVAREYLITLSFFKTNIIEKFAEMRVNTQKKIQTILRLLLLNSKTYLTYLKEINRESMGIQRDLERSLRNEELVKLLNLEKNLVYYTTSIRSNDILVDKLTRYKLFTQYEQDKALLDDVVVESKQALEMAHIYSNILSGMMNAFASVISNNLNVVMKFLTIVTIILMIPTLVASLYGMNIDLPGQRSPYAFVTLVVLSVLLAVIGIMFFRKRQFL